MKKIIALTLALLMVCSLALTAFAEETEELGSITINKISTENVYEIYKLLDLESYNVTSGAYSYKVNEDWTGFFASEGALAYVMIDNAGYVTWTAGEDDETIAAFAKLALAYAKENDIDPVKSSKNEGEFVVVDGKGKFSDLELGYYLVDSTMGALCGLTTTNPDASINAKNAAPTIDKQVQEDSTAQWGDENTADIGQTVSFRVTINVHPGAENYVLHDDMSAGLTFKEVVRIDRVIPGADEASTVTKTVSTEDYQVITEGINDGCEFEIKFSQRFCNDLNGNDKVIIYYDAMLNRNAIVAEDGNPNEAWLEFGEDHYTTHDTTKTYTFGFDLIKTDSQNQLLDGAAFRIYDAATGGTEVKVVLMEDKVTYRRARPDEDGVEIVVTNGQVRVVGFDNGVYYLEEVQTPEGYNQLTARQKFTISDENLDATFNGGIFSTGSGVHVVNKTGSMLPETGALGTTMFITFGMFVVLATGLLLVTKKRMSMIED